MRKEQLKEIYYARWEIECICKTFINNLIKKCILTLNKVKNPRRHERKKITLTDTYKHNINNILKKKRIMIKNGKII